MEIADCGFAIADCGSRVRSRYSVELWILSASLCALGGLLRGPAQGATAEGAEDAEVRLRNWRD